MSNNGKQLESLVAFVEKTLVPKGLDVRTRACVYDDSGVAIAEFDVEIRGQVGSTEIAWLIECRDRPSEGPAPGSWIQQLVGRRSYFAFNKVTAVSTTGFSKGANDCAQKEGIELRTVKALEPEAFADWLGLRTIHSTTRIVELVRANLMVPENSTAEMGTAFMTAIQKVVPGSRFLIPKKEGIPVSAEEAFRIAIDNAGESIGDVAPDVPPTPIRIRAQYLDNDHYTIETALGPVPIRAIEFLGTIRVVTTEVPLALTAEYGDADGERMISQVAAFAPVEFHGARYAIEMHRIPDSGETHVILRKVGDSD